MFGQAGLLVVAPGQLHKAAGTEGGVPHGLVNQRQIGGVGVEGVVAVDAVPGKVEAIGQDEEGEEETWGVVQAGEVRYEARDVSRKTRTVNRKS